MNDRRWLTFLFLSLSLSVPFSCAVAASPLVAQTTAKSNVLFIVVDDLKPMLGAYGDALAKTPNIDRLAKMGTVFLKSYAQQAVCAPSRASLLTGQRPDVTKIWDLKTLIREVNPGIVTLPEFFKQNGYATVGIGKVFDARSVDEQSDAQSWSVAYQRPTSRDFAAGLERPSQGHYQNPNTRRLAQQFEEQGRKNGLTGAPLKDFVKGKIFPAYESENVPDDAYTDGAVARVAVRTLGELAKQKTPFFYAVGFVKPHLPFVAPKAYWDLYEHVKIPLAAFRERSKDAVDVAYTSISGGELGSGYTDSVGNRLFDASSVLSDGTQRNLIHAYYASVSYTDAQVGKVLDELKKQGLEKNTIIVLWGDHGWHLGDHLLWAKHTNFEQATHAPLIIVSPKHKGGQRVEGLTEFVDVFPTLSELAGLKTPANLAGVSLVNLLNDPNAAGRRFALSQYPRDNDRLMGYAIRSARYRYVAWLEKNFRGDALTMQFRQAATELYDMQNDPNETANLARDPASKSTLDEHQKYLMDFLAQQKPLDTSRH